MKLGCIGNRNQGKKCDSAADGISMQEFQLCQLGYSRLFLVLQIANDSLTADVIDSFEPGENATSLDDLGFEAAPAQGKNIILKVWRQILFTRRQAKEVL